MSASTADVARALTGPMASFLGPIVKAEEVLGNTRDGIAAIGSTIWGRSFMHLVHAAVFVTFVIKRDAVTLPLAGWTVDRLGTFLGSVPADAVRLAAASFDSIWTLILRPIGL